MPFVPFVFRKKNLKDKKMIKKEKKEKKIIENSCE